MSLTSNILIILKLKMYLFPNSGNYYSYLPCSEGGLILWISSSLCLTFWHDVFWYNRAGEIEYKSSIVSGWSEAIECNCKMSSTERHWNEKYQFCSHLIRSCISNIYEQAIQINAVYLGTLRNEIIWRIVWMKCKMNYWNQIIDVTFCLRITIYYMYPTNNQKKVHQSIQGH